MLNVIPDTMSASAFDSDDLAEMQHIFEEACLWAGSPKHYERAVLAIAIYNAHRAGVRNLNKLFEIATLALQGVDSLPKKRTG